VLDWAAGAMGAGLLAGCEGGWLKGRRGRRLCAINRSITKECTMSLRP